MMDFIVQELADGWSTQVSSLDEADDVIAAQNELIPDGNEWRISLRVDDEVRVALARAERAKGLSWHEGIPDGEAYFDTPGGVAWTDNAATLARWVRDGES